MSACIVPFNPDYRKLLSETPYKEETLNAIIQQYWKEHPEKGVTGHEVYPTKEYVDNFFNTSTAVVDAGMTVRVWRNNYREAKEIQSPEEEQAYRQEVLQYFNEDAILSYTTKDGKRFVKVARPILESDGRNFSFNREQKYAISRISEWVMDKSEGKTTDEWIVLEGEAGTGKTSIINDIILNSLTIHNGDVMVGAVSNQATDNIMDKLTEQTAKLVHINRKTVAGMLGLKVDKNNKNKGFVEDPYLGTPIIHTDMVIIDEASMVTEQLIEKVKIAASRGIPVLFIGDEAQVRPIREGKWFEEHKVDKNADAPVFSNRSNTEFIKLIERVRQGEGSPILDFAHAYRNSWKHNTPLPKIPGRKSSSDGRIIFTAKRATELLNDLIPVFKEAIRTNNPNLIHIVPYNRDYEKSKTGVILGVKARSALWWNQKIYDVLHPEKAGTYELMENDLVRFDNDYTVDEYTQIHNSDNAQVIFSEDEKTDIYGVRYRMVTLDWNDEEVTVPVVSQDIDNLNKFTAVKNTLFAKAGANIGGITFSKVHYYIDGYADVNLSYALNVHRAQGSTYDITILDQDNIDGAPNVGGYKDNASLGYTAATRAKNVLLVASSKADEKDMPFNLLDVNSKANLRRTNPNPYSEFGRIVDAATKQASIKAVYTSPASKGTFENIEENTEMKAEDVLSAIVSGELSSTVSPKERAYAKSLIPLVTSAGVKVKFVFEGTPEKSAAGHYYHRTEDNITAGNDVTINLISFKTAKVPARVILHKVTHSLTSDRLRNDASFRQKVQDIMDYVKEVVRPVAAVEERTYEIQKPNGEMKTYVLPFDIYGLYSPEEFFSAVMTEEPFQEMLKAIPAKEENKSLWTKLVEAVASTFNRLFNRKYSTNKSVFDVMVPVIAGVMTHEAAVGRAYATQATSFDGLTDNEDTIKKLDDVVDAIMTDYGDNNMLQPKNTQTESKVETVKEQKNSSILNSFSLHSGGAEGADSLWDEFARKYGIPEQNIKHYYHGRKTPKGNTPITEAEFEEGKQKVLQANKTLHRKPESYMDLLARNWLQVKNSDAVFAIGTVSGIEGSGKFYNQVNGGTGWAVQMAIDAGKPVYVFDLMGSKWKYDYSSGEFKLTNETPILTKNFAGIGTRDTNVNENTLKVAKEAITEVFEKTLLSLNPTQGTMTVEKPEPLVQPKNAPYFVSEEEQSPQDAQKFAKALSFITLAETPEATIVENLTKDIISGKLAISTKLIPDINGTVDDLIRNIRTLRKVKQDKGSFLYSAASVPIEASRFTQEELSRLEKNGIQNDGKNVMIPAFSVGLSEKELSDINKREKIANTKLFNGVEIRSIGVKILWKTSDIVTQLQTKGLSASKQFLSSLGDVANKDFTSESRLGIIQKVGIDNLIKVSADTLLPYKEDDTVKKTRRKQFIKENLDVIVEQAQDFLAKNEEITLTTQSTKKSIITTPLGGQLTEAFDVDGEIQIAEVEGSSAEHWQVGFRQVSAVSSLATIIRRNLSSLLALNADCTAVQEEFGPKLLDVHQAVLDMLHWVSGAKDSNEMVDILKSRIATHPWLNQLVGEYHEEGNLSNPVKAGILMGEENSQLRTKFFTNFSKFFQSYIVMYKDEENNTRLRGINTNTYSEQVMNELQALDSAKNTDHGLTIWKNGQLSEAFNDLQAIVGYAASRDGRLPATGLVAAGQQQEVTNEVLGKIQKALGILNIQAPSIDELKIVITRPANVADIASKLGYVISGIKELAKNPADFSLFGKNNSVRNNIKDILKIFEPVMSTSTEAVAYEAGKMHYGYVNPSYLNMFVRDLQGNVADYEAFMQENFRNYTGWFYTPSNHPTLAGNGWLNYWIQVLNTKDDKGKYIWRGMLDHTASLAFEGTGYADKTPASIAASYLQAYFYDSHEAAAYYRVMLLSNKPSEEYIKFIRLKNNYRGLITDSALLQIFMAEINRIKTVAERITKVDAGIMPKDTLVASLETKNRNGVRFQFLKFLNDEIENKTPLGNAVLSVLNAGGKVDLTAGEHVNLAELFRDGFNKFMDTRFEEFLNNLENDGAITRENGEITSVFGVQDMVGIGNRAKENLREFFWNDWFAQVNMFQIFMGDPAQYSNAEDIQKRAAQLHAPGVRPDLAALDTKTHYEVSDGFERFMVVKDIIKRSDIIEALDKIHNKILSDPKYSVGGKLTALGKERNAALKRVRDAFEEVNWADGQALISPTGLRKKMHLLGNWTPHMEEVYDKIMKGGDNFTNKDLDVIWPVIKPFSYSQIAKNTHSQFMPFFRLGVQQKDSEFVLILVDALARREGIDTKFSALYDIMEESSYQNKQPLSDGIDAIMFDSTIKTGVSGAIDIANLTPDDIRKTLREKMRATGEVDINGSNRAYNPDYVYEIPFRDWSQQQEVPFHFEGKQQMGSQGRPLAAANIADTHIDASGKVVDNMIEVNGTKMKVSEAKKNYFDLLAQNIKDSADDLWKSLGFNTNNKQLQNIALSRMLVSELSKDGRYGPDMLRAVSVDKNGNFITPLSDPMLAGTIQQMLNAIIKNRIYKQEIEGGPLVQVSSFGLNRDLRVVTDEKTGRPLYAEVIISAPEEWYKIPEFLDENGNLSVDKINAIDPKILEMIGYRIPTEDKYSMLPFKVVGFMSRSTEGIVLPKEITVLSGSDFDVDKLYVMRRAFDRSSGTISINTKNTRDNNNNKMLDYMWAFLTSDLAADQTLSAGNFDEEKRVAYTIAAADNLEDKSTISSLVEKLRGQKSSKIKDLAYKPYDLMFADTQIKFFKQNMIAAKLIGVFAQANISHAFVSMMDNAGQNPHIEIPDELAFTLVDNRGVEHHIKSNIPFDTEYDWSGIKRISATFAELIGASVDSVKDPVFNLMNVNMSTVNVLATVLRMGWDIDSAAWFLTTPVIKELVKRYSLANETGNARIEDIITQMQLEVLDNKPDTFQENHGWSKAEFVNLHNLEVKPVQGKDESQEDFIMRSTQQGHTNWQLLELFRRMQAISDSTRSITHMTRQNSIASAPGPYAANTIVNMLKSRQFDINPSLDGIRPAINNPVLTAFRMASEGLFNKILGQNLTQAGPLAQLIYETMQNYYGYISNSMAQEMSEFMMSFLVNLNNPVFDLSEGNRRYMILGFPTLFVSMRTRYPDNLLLKSITYKTDTKSGKAVLELNSRGLEESDIQDIKAAWSDLYKKEQARLAQLGSTYNKHENENLAIKLVEYNFFRGGLGFSPKTFMRLVPEDIKDALPNYRENTRLTEQFDPSNFEGTAMENLMYQYMLNTGNFNMRMVDSLNIKRNESTGTLFVVEKDASAAGLKTRGIIPVRTGKSINYYKVESQPLSGIYTLEKVEKLGGDGFAFEIDPNTDVTKIKSVFALNSVTPKSGSQNPDDLKVSDGRKETLTVEPDSTTMGLINQMIGSGWQTESTVEGAFKQMSDKFLDFWASGIDNITKDDNFVISKLQSVNWNLPKEQVKDMIARAIKELDEQNICR